MSSVFAINMRGPRPAYNPTPVCIFALLHYVGHAKRGRAVRDRVLYFYLGPRQRAQVAAREPKILTRIAEVAEAAGWQVVLLPEEARHAATSIDGYHMVLNQAVPGPFCLSLRQCYMEPFWRIEAANDRWAWETARLHFDPKDVKSPYVQAFFNRWRGNLFGARPILQEGFIFVPLQGKLLRHRHFQAMSPLEMLETVLTREVRPVVATMHPGETYEPEEIEALQKLGQRHPHFTLSSAPSMDLLASCDMVVTQNSSMALKGCFAEKRAVLFADADFHHVAGSVPRDGLAKAFDISRKKPPFAPYLFWFFKMHAITSWSDEVHAQIASRLRQHGWPV